MRKSFLIIFSLFYLVLASGLSISLHYCCGKLKDVSVFSSINENDCCGSKKKSKGCCHEKTAFIKVKDNHVGGTDVKVSNEVKTISTPIFNQIFEIHNLDIFASPLSYHAPPVSYTMPIYLKHRVLVI